MSHFSVAMFYKSSSLSVYLTCDYLISYAKIFLMLDPDYLAFIESLNKAEEAPPSIEAHLEEIEAKKCKYLSIIFIENAFSRMYLMCSSINYPSPTPHGRDFS